MISSVLLPLVRRAILDLVEDTGGELNDDVVTVLLNELGHRVARRDVRQEMVWLGEHGWLKTRDLGAFLVASSSPDGRDIANGLLRVEGVSRHKTGD